MPQNANDIISALQTELRQCIRNGAGPFLAAVYDADGKLIAKAANSVVRDKCSHCHAEMNAIKAAEQALGTYDLSDYNLSLYVTSEPCLMCLGGIMWSGIKAVYYSVPSVKVEQITGFDEGFKANWHQEFEKRGIKVVGNIGVEEGEAVLREYMALGKTVYRPGRQTVK